MHSSGPRLCLDQLLPCLSEGLGCPFRCARRGRSRSGGRSAPALESAPHSSTYESLLHLLLLSTTRAGALADKSARVAFRVVSAYQPVLACLWAASLDGASGG